MTEVDIAEEQMVRLVRNALLVAGHEMGEGDHWPVVKNTIYKIMKDWEDLKIERAVHKELRKHVYEQLDEMDRILLTRNKEEQEQDAPKLKALREIYDPYFSPADENQISLSEEDVPLHVKRAENLILSLEDDHAE